MARHVLFPSAGLTTEDLAVTYEQLALVLLPHLLDPPVTEQIISRMARAERAGKVFVDWSQNAEHKTTVCVYSVPAKRPEPGQRRQLYTKAPNRYILLGCRAARTEIRGVSPV
jgi:DNA primase